MKTRPTIKSPCVADTHHGPNERIAEFSFPNLTARQVVAAPNVLRAIQRILDGNEWNADTCDRIAGLLQANGYEVRDL